ncbi:hypothetical protein O3M35_000289 [Rhynocoris fuscipes]|uniref:Uncharacterized protein n=1 Tax=Rhynocoris fuscipes TaxID=488301 RepID=A0AAW1DNV7_9HEMI
MADDSTSLGDIVRYRQSDSDGTEQYSGQVTGSMPFLQFRFHYLFIIIFLLHSMHHYGLPLL